MLQVQSPLGDPDGKEQGHCDEGIPTFRKAWRTWKVRLILSNLMKRKLNMEWDIPYLRRIGYSPQGRNSGVKSLFDRTEPAIGRTRPADGSDFLREIAAVCRPFLFAFWLSLPLPHGSDVCGSTGRRISPDTPELRIFHGHTRVKI